MTVTRTIILAGPDHDGLAGELEALGAEVVRVEGIATRDSLDAAGLREAHTLVLTEMDDASAIPVAKEANTEVRIVTYSRESLPEFARGQADLAGQECGVDREVGLPAAELRQRFPGVGHDPGIGGGLLRLRVGGGAVHAGAPALVGLRSHG